MIQPQHTDRIDALPFVAQKVSTAPLSNLTIGGTAEWLATVHTLDELVLLLTRIREANVPWLILGDGTNTVFAPQFFGVLIRIAADRISFRGQDAVCEAGARWMPLLHEAAKRGLGGMEQFAGLPGTIGGALRGNAGCFGREMRDVLVQATVAMPDGSVQTVPGEWFQYSYRFSRLKREAAIIWDAELHFEQRDPATIQEAMKATASMRASKQPAGKSTGSFFLNPGEHNAGKLIDEAGLKGYKIGGAFVSEKHGNFLMNDGSATPEDLASLIVTVQEEVRKTHGIELEPEVELVNRVWWHERGVRFRRYRDHR